MRYIRAFVIEASAVLLLAELSNWGVKNKLVIGGRFLDKVLKMIFLVVPRYAAVENPCRLRLQCG